MKIRILAVGTALTLLSLFSTASAAEPLPQSVQDRAKRIVLVCLAQVTEQVTNVERAGGSPHFFVDGPNGTPIEVNRIQFIAVGAHLCALQAFADDPLLAPYLVPATPVAAEVPL